MEGSKQEMLVKDRDSLAKIDKLERDRSKALQEEQMAREEIESELKSKLRQLESEVVAFFFAFYICTSAAAKEMVLSKQ